MKEISDAELTGIIDLIRARYGYDFSNYAMSSFKRRVLRMMELKHMTFTSLVGKLMEEPAFVNDFLNELTVNVTEMFRDDAFWKVLRTDIIPKITAGKHPIKIWHAGCSTGEEVFSMAILLREMGLGESATIVATDIDLNVLEKARAGSYPLKSMELNEKNYLRVGGMRKSLKEYYHVHGASVQFDTDLVRSVSFQKHDLVTGAVLNKFDLILCRNVMIYFNQSLQNDVLKKFHKSLVPKGYLAIGSKESLIWCDISNKFLVVHPEEKIYQKIKE